MKVQSVLLATMFFAMSKTSKNLKYSWMFLILASLLFFTLPVNLFNHGIFWGAASSNYLWPLLPLFLFVNYFFKKRKDIIQGNNLSLIDKIYSVILIIMSTFSHEQIGISLIVFISSWLIFDIKNKELRKVYVYAFIVAIIFYSFLIFAPGNYSRLYNVSASGNFYSLSISEKINLNYPILRFYTDILLGNILKYSLVFYLSVFTFSFLKNRGINERLLLASTLGISGLSTIVVMLVSPVLPGRIMIVFAFFLIAMNVVLFDEFCRLFHPVLGLIIIILISFESYWNGLYLYNGYKSNYEILEQNHQKLLDFTHTDLEIKLFKNVDDTFSGAMPYQAGYEYINQWIKEYYDLNPEVELIWVGQTDN